MMVTRGPVQVATTAKLRQIVRIVDVGISQFQALMWNAENSVTAT